MQLTDCLPAISSSSTSSPLFLTKLESETEKLYSIKYTDQMRKLPSNDIANEYSAFSLEMHRITVKQL